MNNNLSISVCSGGWNARDALDAMPITDALIYDNFIHQNGRDRVRAGYIKEADILGTNVLFAHNKNNAGRILAIRGSEFTSYDSGFNPVLDTSIVDGANWRHCQFVDGAGTLHSIMTNTSPTVYNFTTDGDEDILDTCEWRDSGSQPINKYFSFPFSYKNRLYFVESESFSIWYGGVQSYQGELKQFAVNSFFKKGGKLIAGVTWTQDGGDGTDDQLCLFSDSGEVLVYSGSSPDSDDWALKGRYEIPRPINDKMIKQVKGDIVVGTVSGYVMLSSVLSELSAQRVALSNKINNAIIDKKPRFNDNYWDCIYYANANRLIFNVPSTEAGLNYEWHVFNLENGTWSRFLGQNSLTFCCLNDNMYFCNASGIYQDNIGTTDNGHGIKFRLHHAYTDFGIKQKKKINRLILRYSATNIEDLYKYVWCDYKETAKTFVLSKDVALYDLAEWDNAKWDESRWADVATLTTMRAGVAHIPATYLSVGFWGATKTNADVLGADLMVVAGNGAI